MEGLETYWAWAPTALLVLARFGGLFLLAPALSHRVIPARLRWMMALVFCLAVTAGLNHPKPYSIGPGLILPLISELLLGVAVGYAGAVLLAGVSLAAAHISQQIGLSLAQSYNNDSDQDSANPIARFMELLAVVIFLSAGGHRVLIGLVVDSFDVLPPGGWISGGSILAPVVDVIAAGFVIAIRLALPVLSAMLLATSVIGMLQRTMPGFHVFSTGLPVQALMGLVVLALALGGLGAIVEVYLDQVNNEFRGVLTGH